MVKGTLINCSDTVNEYVNREDWRIKANANTGYSNSGLVNNIAGKVIANFWFDEVYSKEEGDAHRNGDYHIHDADCLSPYCCGHDLQKLLQEGFNGVVSRVESKPPKHFREALYQMANFIGILQAEWAGAQAFSSFDTYLAPYVFHDMYVEGMDERDIKKALINFVYNLNVPSRWGQCVPLSYRCLKGDGSWVSYENLHVGDEIYVVDMETGLLKKDKITHLNLFDSPKKMHRYANKSNGFKFEVTPNHRVIYKIGSNKLKIKESTELLDYDIVGIPVTPWGKQTPETFMSNEYDIQDELLELIAYIMTDGTITKQDGKQTRISWFKSPRRFGIERFEELCDILGITYSRRKDESSKFEGSFVYEYRLNSSDIVTKITELLNNTKHEVPEFMQYLSPRQCYIILDAWVLMDGHFDGAHWKMQADNKKIQEMLAYLAIKAGKAVSLNERLIGTNKNATIYTNLHKRQIRSCVVSEVEASCEKVWCPTTETGTFVCMTDEGYVFLTGNSPFSNVTIDLKVPKNLESLAPMRYDIPYFVSVYNEGLMDKISEAKKSSIGESNYLKFIDEVRKRTNDYESDEETLMYSLTYKHFKPEMDIINRCFYQILCEGDVNGQPFTFPIPTINITEDFDWDNPNYYWVWENTAKYGSSYFQNFIGSQYIRDENGRLTIRDENAYSPDDVRSMCPLTFETEVLVRSQWYAGYQQIGHIYNRNQKHGTKYECFYNGQWIPCSVVKVPNQTVYELTLSNNTSYKMGAYHLQPVYRDGKRIEISVKDIKPGDYIPFNSSIVDSGFIKSSYELGYAVGAYLGDGCGKDYIIYSLDAREKDDETVHKLQKFWEGLGLSTSITINGNLRTLKVNAKRAYEVIKPFITGSNALDKGISNIINTQSVDMRQGLIDGYIATDGNRTRHRISTSSKQMVSDLIALFNSLGIKAYCFYTDTRDNRLGENPNYVVAYILNKDNYAKKYHTIDGEVYWEVTDIKEIPYKGQLYCLETESEHHLFTLKDGLITHNCRLQLDKKALRKRGGGLFGSDAQTGSIGVVTLNMARLGYTFKGNIDGLYKRVKELCDMAKSTLEKKRVFVTKMYEEGLYPYTRRYVRTFDTYFSTIGVNGMNEMVRNFTNDEYDITDSRGQEMCKNILDYINKLLLQYQEETGNLYNLEASPAEGTTRRLAKSDQQRYPGILQAGCEDAPYYTNSSQLPVDFTADPFKALDLQEELQKKYTGGTVLHLYMNERISSPEVCKQLVKKVLSNYRLPYISITPSFSVCPKHGYISGDHEFCPLCDREILAEHANEVDFNK